MEKWRWLFTQQRENWYVSNTASENRTDTTKINSGASEHAIKDQSISQIIVQIKTVTLELADRSLDGAVQRGIVLIRLQQASQILRIVYLSYITQVENTIIWKDCLARSFHIVYSQFVYVLLQKRKDSQDGYSPDV